MGVQRNPQHQLPPNFLQRLRASKGTHRNPFAGSAAILWGLDVIRKEAWPFYRTISGVPKGPKGSTALDSCGTAIPWGPGLPQVRLSHTHTLPLEAKAREEAEWLGEMEARNLMEGEVETMRVCLFASNPCTREVIGPPRSQNRFTLNDTRMLAAPPTAYHCAATTRGRSARPMCHHTL